VDICPSFRVVAERKRRRGRLSGTNAKYFGSIA
jgi:hypothetical protein